MQYPKPIQDLIDKFSKFPTVGPRTASRFVFYLLSLPKNELENLIDTIKNLDKQISICSSCFNPFEKIDDYGICQLCRSPKRDKNILCIVEKEADLISIEKTKKYNGLYFVLGGLWHPLKKEELQNIRLEELKNRLEKDKQIQEIIMAINPTVEGEATISFLIKNIKEINPEVKITKLGRGLPQGGELEYADEGTISGSLENRR